MNLSVSQIRLIHIKTENRDTSLPVALVGQAVPPATDGSAAAATHAIKFVTVPYIELTQIKFLNIFFLNLNLRTINSVIFQYTAYNTNKNYMLGKQVGVVVKDNHDLHHYISLYDHFLETLDLLMDRYHIEIPDFITFRFRTLVLPEDIKVMQNKAYNTEILRQAAREGRLMSVSKIIKDFNSSILPYTYRDKYFGYFLDGDLRKNYLRELIILVEKNQNPFSTSTRVVAQVASVASVASVAGVSGERQSAECGLGSTLSILALYSNLSSSALEVTKAQGGSHKDSAAIAAAAVDLEGVSLNSDLNLKLKNKDKDKERIKSISFGYEYGVEFLESVINSDAYEFRVFLSNSKKHLIISCLDQIYNYNRYVFNIKTGQFLFLSKDILNIELDNSYKYLNKLNYDKDKL